MITLTVTGSPASPDVVGEERSMRAVLGPLTQPLPGGNVFAGPVATAAAAHLDGGDSVRLLSASDGDGVALALPVHRVRGFRRVAVPALSSWQHDYCFLGDPWLRPGSEREAWGAVLDLAPAPWLVLEGVSGDGPGFDGLRAALDDRGLRSTEHQRHERAVVRRRPESTYLDERLKGAHRKNLRRLARHLGTLLGGDLVLVERSGDPQAHARFLALEAAGWKGREGTALANRPGHAEFLRALVATAPGAVQLWSLEVGGTMVAAQVNLRSGSTSSCFKTTYDETLARYSPGMLLEMALLEAFHADEAVDLLDSCAVAGHEMAERLFPDRRSIVTLLVPMTRAGRVAVRATPALARMAAGLTRHLEKA